MHHSMLGIDIINSMVNRLRRLYSKNKILKLESRDYYNVIKPGSYYDGSKIVIVFKFPIISSDSFDFYKLCILPNKNHSILVPSLPFLATNGDDYVYIETKCPKLKSRFICEEKFNHQITDGADCIHKLISNQLIDQNCSFTTLYTRKEAMEKLDDRHYALIFPYATRVKLFCRREDYITLKGSYLATIPQNCYIHTKEFTIKNIYDKLEGEPMKIDKITTFLNSTTPEVKTSLQFNSINLHKLHNIENKISLQSPIKLEDPELNVIHHTTIPIYALVGLISITALIIAAHRYLKRRKNLRINVPEIEDKEDKRDATFQLNVLK